MDRFKQKKAIDKEVNAYRKLKKIQQSEEFDTFFDLLFRTCAQKMIWTFTTDDITWEQFQKVKGEITSYLYPIQEVKSASAMEEHLKQQLEEYFSEES